MAREVGRLKNERSIPIEDEEVEDALIQGAMEECDKAGLDRSSGLKIVGVLLAESKRAQGMKERPTPGSVLARAKALQRKGVDVIRLDVGEPDFHPPQAVLKACSEALYTFKTHYTESQGIPELRSALRSYLKKKSGFRVSDEEIAITPSGRFAVYAALSTVVGEGESAVVIEPNWPAYREVLESLRARPLIIRTALDEEWTPSVNEIQERIRRTTRAIILSYPNNPTGKVISIRRFKEIVKLADDLGLTVLSDEIYNEYSSKPCPSVFKTTPKKFILTSSFSKTWAMTGFRIGYAVSSKETVSSIAKSTSLMFTSVPEFIQWGAIKALSSSSEVKRNAIQMRTRVEAACEALDNISSIEFAKPEGAMYVFPRIKTGETGDSFAERLLEKGVSVTPGTAFGDYPDFFRISLGQPKEKILQGVGRIGELLS